MSAFVEKTPGNAGFPIAIHCKLDNKEEGKCMRHHWYDFVSRSFSNFDFTRKDEKNKGVSWIFFFCAKFYDFLVFVLTDTMLNFQIK